LNFCKRARAFWLIVAMLHYFKREQEIFGWNWGGEHKGAYLNFGAIICPITEVLHFPSHSEEIASQILAGVSNATILYVRN
jgi:hypothetical protein